MIPQSKSEAFASAALTMPFSLHSECCNAGNAPAYSTTISQSIWNRPAAHTSCISSLSAIKIHRQATRSTFISLSNPHRWRFLKALCNVSVFLYIFCSVCPSVARLQHTYLGIVFHHAEVWPAPFALPATTADDQAASSTSISLSTSCHSGTLNAWRDRGTSWDSTSDPRQIGSYTAERPYDCSQGQLKQSFKGCLVVDGDSNRSFAK